MSTSASLMSFEAAATRESLEPALPPTSARGSWRLSALTSATKFPLSSVVVTTTNADLSLWYCTGQNAPARYVTNEGSLVSRCASRDRAVRDCCDRQTDRCATGSASRMESMSPMMDGRVSLSTPGVARNVSSLSYGASISGRQSSVARSCRQSGTKARGGALPSSQSHACLAQPSGGTGMVVKDRAIPCCESTSMLNTRCSLTLETGMRPSPFRYVLPGTSCRSVRVPKAASRCNTTKTPSRSFSETREPAPTGRVGPP